MEDTANQAEIERDALMAAIEKIVDACRVVPQGSLSTPFVMDTIWNATYKFPHLFERVS